MPRRSQFTPETVERILDAIALSGSDRAGWVAGGIAETTFYRWQEENKEFREGVNLAKQEYRKVCPEAVIREARQRIYDYVSGKMQKVTITEHYTLNREGSLVKEGESITRTPILMPAWVASRVLGEHTDELSALTVLVSAGWLPSWLIRLTIDELNALKSTIRETIAGVIPEREFDQRKRGLSQEGADAIRAELNREILGIRPPDPPQLPGTVDSGQESD